MKLHYYPETDSLYIELKSVPGAETREIAEGLLVDFDARATSSVSTSIMRPANSISPRSRRLRCRRRARLNDGRDLRPAMAPAPARISVRLLAQS